MEKRKHKANAFRNIIPISELLGPEVLEKFVIDDYAKKVLARNLLDHITVIYTLLFIKYGKEFDGFYVENERYKVDVRPRK